MKVCLRCNTGFSSENWTCPSCGWTPQFTSGLPLFAPHLSDTREGFDPQYFDRLFRLEGDNFWFLARNKLILWAIGQFFPWARHFLEVGCGTGFVLAGIEAKYPGMRLVGSELHAEGLAHTARRLGRATFLQMDARQIPYDREFDLIGAFDVIEHIEEDDAVLNAINHALRPGGGLLLTVPQHDFLWSAADDYAFHKRRYSRIGLLSKLEMAGFRLRYCTSFVTLLMPLLVTSRLLHRSATTYDPEAEFRLARPANWLLKQAMGAERFLIRSGSRLPFGGSLLIAVERI